jgi:hypothetical protein
MYSLIAVKSKRGVDCLRVLVEASKDPNQNNDGKIYRHPAASQHIPVVKLPEPEHLQLRNGEKTLAPGLPPGLLEAILPTMLVDSQSNSKDQLPEKVDSRADTLGGEMDTFEKPLEKTVNELSVWLAERDNHEGNKGMEAPNELLERETAKCEHEKMEGADEAMRQLTRVIQAELLQQDSLAVTQTEDIMTDPRVYEVSKIPP